MISVNEKLINRSFQYDLEMAIFCRDKLLSESQFDHYTNRISAKIFLLYYMGLVPDSVIEEMDFAFYF